MVIVGEADINNIIIVQERRNVKSNMKLRKKHIRKHYWI
jgi:hypothetical protein